MEGFKLGGEILILPLPFQFLTKKTQGVLTVHRGTLQGALSPPPPRDPLSQIACGKDYSLRMLRIQVGR